MAVSNPGPFQQEFDSVCDNNERERFVLKMERISASLFFGGFSPLSEKIFWQNRANRVFFKPASP